VTTIAIYSHPRPNRNGRISALIVSMGLAVVLGSPCITSPPQNALS